MKKWFFIRHIRYFWLTLRFNLWWHRTGSYLGLVPNPNDIEYLEKVWRGEI